MASAVVTQEEELADLLDFLSETNIFEEDDDMQEEVECVTSEIANTDTDDVLFSGFSCTQCEKVCKSKRGLTRHINVKHPVESDDPSENKAGVERYSVDELIFQRLIMECCSKMLAENKDDDDECCLLPVNVVGELKNFSLTGDEVRFCFQSFQKIIADFVSDGNDEKFFPKFHNLVNSKEVFSGRVSKDTRLFLGYELAVHTSAYIGKKHLSSTSSSIDYDLGLLSLSSFSQKERDIVCYLSGYVFGTLSRKIRKCRNWSSKSSQQSLSILRAAKTEENHSDVVLVNVHDRGGLWKLRLEACKIFLMAERYFRINTEGDVRKIDVNRIVVVLLKNSEVLNNFNSICSETEEPVDKEISLNLLENLLSLYLRLRSFSFAKDKVQKHQLLAKSKQKRSLRTGLKQASNNK